MSGLYNIETLFFALNEKCASNHLAIKQEPMEFLSIHEY